ncbi:hypothetical protein Mapa_009979 [Marchantia paleacea]|nr:hypothetical protein Mapa_009979 [Marchantia paleacea]
MRFPRPTDHAAETEGGHCGVVNKEDNEGMEIGGMPIVIRHLRGQDKLKKGWLNLPSQSAIKINNPAKCFVSLLYNLAKLVSGQEEERGKILQLKAGLLFRLGETGWENHHLQVQAHNLDL